MALDINWIGMQTVYTKEVRRYLKVYNQTLFAPVVNSMLFLAVFSLAMGDRITHMGAVTFHEFMASGLIMMAVMQNAFANSSSSFTMGKVMGTLVDFLMPPLSAMELIIGMVGAAVTRGVMVCILVALAVWVFTPLQLIHPFTALFFLISASVMLALLGLITGIIADGFDQMSAVTSYVITPLSFLSGTFYSVNDLPSFWHAVSHYNPFFYLIDGFRYGMSGHADGDITIGIWYSLVINAMLWMTCHVMIKTGYRIKT